MQALPDIYKNVRYIWLLSDVCETCSCILPWNLNPYENPV